MTLRNYLIDEDLGMVLERYSRDNDISPSLVIEKLLETFLYKKEYIQEEVNDIVETPAEIYAKRRDNFIVKHRTKDYYQLTYDDISFGFFKKGEINDIIDKLLDFSDEELQELNQDNWEYSSKQYKRFLREKLDNPLLTVDEFIRDSRISVEVKNNKGDKITRFNFKGKMILQFKKGTSKKLMEEIYSFLKELSDEELEGIIEDRKKLRVNSFKYVSEYMESYDENKYTDETRLPYTTVIKSSGNLLFQRKGFTFGTHKPQKATEVWDFLDSKNWNPKYSTKGKGLSHKEYLHWLYTEIENEKGIL